MRCDIAGVLFVVTAAVATLAPSGTAPAQGSVPAAAPVRQLSNLAPAAPPPGPPPDCKHHPSFPGCKKKPGGGTSTPKPTPKP
jgi:hypothetical protein